MSIQKLIIGSATHSIKAIRVLSAYSIPASTVKLGNSGKTGGCIYGIEFSDKYTKNVKQILTAEQIKFEEYKNDLFR